MTLYNENYNPAAKYGGVDKADDIENNVLNGNKAADVTDADTTGGIPVLFRIDSAGAGGGNTDVTVDNKVRVIDAWCVLQGAGDTSDTVTVQNAGNAITDAMDVSGSDKALVRAGEIDDAQHEISAGGTLRVAQNDNSGSDAPTITVYVLAVRVA